MKIRDIDVKKRSTLWLHNLHHRSDRARNWGGLLSESSQGSRQVGAFGGSTAINGLAEFP